MIPIGPVNGIALDYRNGNGENRGQARGNGFTFAAFKSLVGTLEQAGIIVEMEMVIVTRADRKALHFLMVIDVMMQRVVVANHMRVGVAVGMINRP